MHVGSAVTLVQAGHANEATVEQSGDGHDASLEQHGGSSAIVIQDGYGNVLGGLAPGSTAFQDGASILFLSQTGVGNTALVEQSDGAVAHITQLGVSNTVTAVQTR